MLNKHYIWLWYSGGMVQHATAYRSLPHAMEMVGGVMKAMEAKAADVRDCSGATQVYVSFT